MPVSLILFFVLNYVFVCVSVYECLHVYAGICGGQTRASNSLELDGIMDSFKLSGCWEPTSGPFSFTSPVLPVSLTQMLSFLSFSLLGFSVSTLFKFFCFVAFFLFCLLFLSFHTLI